MITCINVPNEAIDKCQCHGLSTLDVFYEDNHCRRNVLGFWGGGRNMSMPKVYIIRFLTKGPRVTHYNTIAIFGNIIVHFISKRSLTQKKKFKQWVPSSREFSWGAANFVNKTIETINRFLFHCRYWIRTKSTNDFYKSRWNALDSCWQRNRFNAGGPTALAGV